MSVELLERPQEQRTGRRKPPLKHVEATKGKALCGTRIEKQPSGASEAEKCVVCSALANNLRWSR